MEVLQVYTWMPIPLRDFASPAPQMVCRPCRIHRPLKSFAFESEHCQRARERNPQPQNPLSSPKTEEWRMVAIASGRGKTIRNSSFSRNIETRQRMTKTNDRTGVLQCYLVGIGLHLVPLLRQIPAGRGDERPMLDRGQNAIKPAVNKHIRLI